MRQFTLLALASVVIACSSDPVGPSATTQTLTGLVGGDGNASAAAVTIERIRLRRADGPDIMTTLVTGQVIAVPLDVNLDIWAEIRRLETDRARLRVDWGNGNNDFIGCGSCRLENKYTKEGRYTVTAQVVDLNAPSGTPPILSVTVTLDVADRQRLSCSAVSTDFSSVAAGSNPTFGIPGATFSSGPLSAIADLASIYPPLFVGNAFLTDGAVTLTFDTDKNFVTIDILTTNTPGSQLPVTFQAFDAGGTLVESGSAAATILTTNGFREGTITVGGNTFRKIVFTSPYALDHIAFDNLNASCR